MATFTPYRAKNVDLILGDEAADGPNFKCQVRSVTLECDVNTDEIKTLCPEGSFQDVDEPTWTLNLGYLFGKETDDTKQALWRFLFDNHGQVVPFTYRPWSGDEYGGMKGTVTLSSGGIGGEQGAWSEQSVSLPVQGKPTPLDLSSGEDLDVAAAPSASDPMTAEVESTEATEPVQAEFGDEQAAEPATAGAGQ